MKKVFIILIIIFHFSCTKSFDNSNQLGNILLPAYTKTGANTFGFMLGNSVWTVFGKQKSNIGFGTRWIDNSF